MAQYNRRTPKFDDDVARLPKNIVILMVLLVLILVVGSGALVYFSLSSQATAHVQATATANANTLATFSAGTASARTRATAIAAHNATATVIAANQATATAVAISNVTATAAANTNATATVIAANHNPYPPNTGMLALLDPLSDNSRGHSWNQNSTSCSFSGGAYHVIAPDPRFFASCIATATDFSNFVYEVQMTILKGDVGGILFRANSTNNTSYLFYVTQSGFYELFLCPGTGNTCRQLVTTNSSPAIRQGLNVTNTVAVVVTGTAITLYVNHQQLVTVNDRSFSHGQIGVVASPFANNGHPTEVAYSNARVWTL